MESSGSHGDVGIRYETEASRVRPGGGCCVFLCVVVGKGVEGRGTTWIPQPRGSAQTHIKVRTCQLSGGGENCFEFTSFVDSWQYVYPW